MSANLLLSLVLHMGLPGQVIPAAMLERLDPQASNASEPELEGRELPAGGVVVSARAGPGPDAGRQRKERREADAYIDTAIAASAAAVSSSDGGERSMLDPATVAELSLRAVAATASTAAHVVLTRHPGAVHTLDLATVLAPGGGGVVLTTRF